MILFMAASVCYGLFFFSRLRSPRTAEYRVDLEPEEILKFPPKSALGGGSADRSTRLVGALIGAPSTFPSASLPAEIGFFHQPCGGPQMKHKAAGPVEVGFLARAR